MTTTNPPRQPKAIQTFLLMANVSQTPYFSRFATEGSKNPEIELTFVALNSDRPAMLDEMKQFGYDCHWVKFNPAMRFYGYVTAFFRLFLLFLRHRPNVVHCHLFDDSLPGLLAARLAGIKCRVISKLDTGYHILYRPRFVFFDRFNNFNATDVVAVSEENKSLLIEKELCPAEKITLIHQGIPSNEVTSRSPAIASDLVRRFAAEGKKIVLTVGRFSDIKGYPDVIAAAILVNKARSDVKFILVGDDNTASLEAQIAASGLEETVVLSDWISREELNNLFGLASVYLHAALIEPFGFVIAEAMFNGVPVVSTRVGAAKDALEDGKSAVLVKPGDSAGLARGVLHMLSHDTREMTAHAKVAAEALFSIESMWGKHVKLYLQRCPKPRGQAL